MPREGRGSQAADRSHVLRASAVVSGLGLLAKAVGIAREAAVAAIFGATRAVDGFVVAKSLPDMVSTWIELPVKAAFVPLFTRRQQEDGEASAWAAASNVLNVLFVGLLLVVVVLELASDLLVRAMSLGFDETAWADTASLARVLVLSVLFSTGGVILGSLSNIYRRQFVPGVARVASAIVVLAGVCLLGPRLGLPGYALGILAGSIVTFVVQADVLWRHRRLYRFRLDPRAPEIRELTHLAWPLFVGLSATRLDVLIDRNFASFLPAGSIAILAYALLISVTLTELTVTVSGSVLLPHFAQLTAQRRLDELRSQLGMAIETYLYFVLPLAAIVAGGARPLVDLVYGRGQFTAEDAALTAMLVPVMAFSDPFTGVGQMLAQAHIGAGQTRVPMRIGFYRVGIKVAISIALIGWLGILGLAIAAAVANVVRAGMLWRTLDDAIRPTDPALGRRVAGLVIAAALMVPVSGALFRTVPSVGPGVAGAVAQAVIVAVLTFLAWVAVSAVLGSRVALRLIRRLRSG